jgi:Flp pilus assembly pilin Flp
MMLKKIVAKSKGIVSEDRAAALVEYGMVVGLIAVASIGAVYQVGERTEQTFCLAANALASDMNGHETDPDCETIIANSGLAAGGNAAAQLSPREQEMIDSFSLTTFAHDANARTFDATWAMASGMRSAKCKSGEAKNRLILRISLVEIHQDHPLQCPVSTLTGPMRQSVFSTRIPILRSPALAL